MPTENTPARIDCYRLPTLLWQSQVKGQALTSVTDFLRTGHRLTHTPQGTRPHPHPTPRPASPRPAPAPSCAITLARSAAREPNTKLRAGVCNMLFSSPHLELLTPPITQFGRSILISASHTSTILEKGGHFRRFW